MACTSAPDPFAPRADAAPAPYGDGHRGAAASCTNHHVHCYGNDDAHPRAGAPDLQAVVSGTAIRSGWGRRADIEALRW